MYCVYRPSTNNVLCTDGEFHNIIFVTDMYKFDVKTWKNEKIARKYAASYNDSISPFWTIKVIEVSALNSLQKKHIVEA